jgi:hypothetical protein
MLPARAYDPSGQAFAKVLEEQKGREAGAVIWPTASQLWEKRG